ncbi:hypothetical protein [uncultured Methanobrevibacter sp.]|uniref:hypothetical protein n=1 Tax=uncultured Methanobrevibacter sp. TaxID=253161 RepID=UPI0025E47A97|nr:hypothetical protein [uncultured Methanobrevibacter sp.]
MYCPKCGEENKGNPTYCKKCGTKLKNKEIINEPPKTDNNKNKIIIIGLVAVIVILIVGMLFVGGVFKSETPQANASNSKNTSPSSSVDVPQSSSSEASPAPSSTPSSISIIGGSFSTGSGDADKTYARINVGTAHAGENVIVQIFYSRDGKSLNNGNMVPATVHSDGYLEIASADAYSLYPDHANIKIYDSNSKLLTSRSVSLSPSSGTQTF